MRDKIVEIMLNNKSEFISGEELSKQLGCHVQLYGNI